MDNIKEKVRVAAGKSLDQDDSLSIGSRSDKAVKVSLAVVLLAIFIMEARMTIMSFRYRNS